MKISRDGAILALLFALLCHPGCRGSGEIPKKLMGKWATDDSEYRETQFEITCDTLMFADREGGTEVYPITRVERQKSPNRDWAFLRLLYRTKAGDQHEFSLSYHTSHPGLIKLKNPSGVSWMKISESHQN